VIRDIEFWSFVYDVATVHTLFVSPSQTVSTGDPLIWMVQVGRIVGGCRGRLCVVVWTQPIAA
jgi:hypothetical protein